MYIYRYTLSLLHVDPEEEEHELGLLKGVNTRDTLNEKKYRHLCYLSESAYALAVSDTMNISSNPGFEWQLRYYGI